MWSARLVAVVVVVAVVLVVVAVAIVASVEAASDSWNRSGWVLAHIGLRVWGVRDEVRLVNDGCHYIVDDGSSGCKIG